MSFIRQSEAWLSGNNAAGLRYTPIDVISEIDISAAFNKGSFVDYNQSAQSSSYGVQAGTYYRLNKRTMLFGRISYQNSTGQDMGASVWIDPGFAPFNLVEFSDTTRGEKTMETYHLTGATAIDLSSKLTLGGKIDYRAANYVKKRDLRHLNMLMDLNLSIGALYQMLPCAKLGVNYQYRKRVEETNFDSYGNTDRSFNTLISWGTFWGPVEGFGSEGFTGEGDNNPLVDKMNGFSLQLDLTMTPYLRWFNEISTNQREGYFGVKSDQTKIYTEHNAHALTYNSHLKYSRPKAMHLFLLRATEDKLDNWKNNYYFDYDVGSGVTFVRYKTPTKVLKRTFRQASLGYQLHIGHWDFNPKWSFMADAGYWSREQSVSVYPFFRNQTINQFHGKLQVERNISRGRNQYSFLLGIGFSSGNGTALDAGVYGGSADKESSLQSTDFNLYREYEYLTATSIATQAGFKYSMLLNDDKTRVFAGLRHGMEKASAVSYLKGDCFNTLLLSVGCSF